MPWKAIVRGGLLFGLIAGIFGIAVVLIASLIGNEASPSMATKFVVSGLGFLIFGGAGRRIGLEFKAAAPAWRMGALAGALSELIRTFGASLVLALLPAGQALFNRLPSQQQRLATDPLYVASTLALDVLVVTVFGGLVGWLGAWASLQFGPPTKPGS